MKVELLFEDDVPGMFDQVKIQKVYTNGERILIISQFTDYDGAVCTLGNTRDAVIAELDANIQALPVVHIIIGHPWIDKKHFISVGSEDNINLTEKDINLSIARIPKALFPDYDRLVKDDTYLATGIEDIGLEEAKLGIGKKIALNQLIINGLAIAKRSPEVQNSNTTPSRITYDNLIDIARHKTSHIAKGALLLFGVYASIKATPTLTKIATDALNAARNKMG